MSSSVPCYRSVIIAFAATLLAGPLTAHAAPNAASVAQVAACAETEATAYVCSSKGLSNVILQCSDGESSHFEKFDDLSEDGDIYQGSYTCESGSLEAVFIKSGSFRNAGGPAGAGEMISGLAACPADCPKVAADEEDEEEVGEEDVIDEGFIGERF
jgi:hypothetical protein